MSQKQTERIRRGEHEVGWYRGREELEEIENEKDILYEKITGKMILKCYALWGKASVLVSAYGVYGVCVHSCVWCVCACVFCM